MRRLVAIAAITSVALTGCSSGGRAPDGQDISAAVDVTTSTTLPTKTAPSRSSTAPTPSAPAARPADPSVAAQQTTSTTGAAGATGSPRETTGFVRADAPPCVEIGKTFVVKVTTAPNALVGLVVAFSDNADHGATSSGEADRAGSFQAEMNVPDDTPSGKATIYVGAADGHERGNTTAHTTVAKRGTKCGD